MLAVQDLATVVPNLEPAGVDLLSVCVLIKLLRQSVVTCFLCHIC